MSDNENFDYSGFMGSPEQPGDASDPLSALDSVFGEGGLFEDVDLDTLPKNPFSLPDNTYRFRITKVNIQPTAATKDLEEKKYGFTLTYQVAEGDYENRIITEWLHYPQRNDGSTEAQRIQSLANLKNHLEAYGLSNEDIKKFNHRTAFDMLDGNEFYATLTNKKDKNGKDQVQFSKWSRLEGFTGGDSYDPFAPKPDAGF
jgi:hypothetical protein